MAKKKNLYKIIMIKDLSANPEIADFALAYFLLIRMPALLWYEEGTGPEQIQNTRTPINVTHYTM